MKKKYRIGVDRLEITYTATDEQKEYLSDPKKSEYIYDSFVLRRCECRNYTNEFAIIAKDYNAEIGIYDRTIGFLHFGSPNPNRQNVYMVFGNETLYNRNWLATRFYFGDELGFKFKQISKLDIFVDFNFNINRLFYRVYKNEDYDFVINEKKVHGLTQKVQDVIHIAGHTTRKRPFANPTPIVKNADGSLNLKIYNKGAEIDEDSGKEYVRETAGFGSRIWRMEISCGNHKRLKKALDKIGMSDEDIYVDLQNERVLIGLFKTLMNMLIRVQYKRHSYSLVDIMLDGIE